MHVHKIKFYFVSKNSIKGLIGVCSPLSGNFALMAFPLDTLQEKFCLAWDNYTTAQAPSKGLIIMN